MINQVARKIYNFSHRLVLTFSFTIS